MFQVVTGRVKARPPAAVEKALQRGKERSISARQGMGIPSRRTRRTTMVRFSEQSLASSLMPDTGDDSPGGHDGKRAHPNDKAGAARRGRKSGANDDKPKEVTKAAKRKEQNRAAQKAFARRRRLDCRKKRLLCGRPMRAPRCDDNRYEQNDWLVG